MSVSVSSATNPEIARKRFYSPRTILTRFIAGHGLKGSIAWGLFFGGFTLVNISGFKATYPTPAAADQLAATFSSNVGITLLIGEPHQINTAVGFTDWRVLGTVAIIGSIWGLLRATAVFRGEEAAGRWELFLAGWTTQRRAAANAIAGLCINVLAFFVVVALLVAGVAPNMDESFSALKGISFAAVVTLIVALFMAVGAFASQLMATRGGAAALSASVFGVFFLLRGVSDAIEGAKWLGYISPLSWIEKIHPLTANNLIWTIPVAACIVSLGVATIYAAGKRDMGSSLLADKDSAKAHTALLDLPFTAAFRLTRAAVFGWLAGVTLMALLLGSFAKSAGEALAASDSAGQVITRLSSSAELTATNTYLGIAFFMSMMVIMLFTASSMSAVRNDEAQGYLDNLLVRPLTRQGWLWGRIALTVLSIMVAALLVGIAAWAGASTQHATVHYADLLVASINAMAPALFVLGAGVLAFGFIPRKTSTIAYAVVGWSFIVQMVGSILNLNHWILDLSVLHHIALAPATDPNWMSAGVLVSLGLIGCILGSWRFNARDLQNE